MARFKVKDKKSEPDWLEQRRAKKQEKYDKKVECKKVRHKKPTINSTLGDLWPEAFDERENVC